jgi:hypothetical protein
MQMTHMSTNNIEWIPHTLKSNLLVSQNPYHGIILIVASIKPLQTL